jgi:hypothetical protein
LLKLSPITFGLTVPCLRNRANSTPQPGRLRRTVGPGRLKRSNGSLPWIAGRRQLKAGCGSGEVQRRVLTLSVNLSAWGPPLTVLCWIKVEGLTEKGWSSIIPAANILSAAKRCCQVIALPPSFPSALT